MALNKDTLQLFAELSGEGILATIDGRNNFAEVEEMISPTYLLSLTIADSQSIFVREKGKNYVTHLNN